MYDFNFTPVFIFFGLCGAVAVALIWWGVSAYRSPEIQTETLPGVSSFIPNILLR